MSADPIASRSSRFRWIVLAIFLVALVVAFRVVIPTLIHRTVERGGSSVLATAVTAKGCMFSFLSGELTLSELRVASPVPGDPAPLARLAELAVSLPSLGALLGHELRFGDVTVRGLELAVAGSAGGDSAAAKLQDRVRESQAEAVAADESPGGWLQRVEIGRLSIIDASVIATETGAAGARSSHLDLGQLDFENLSIPLSEVPGEFATATAGLTSAVLTTTLEAREQPILSIGSARSELRIARTAASEPGAEAEVILDIPSIDVQQLAADVRTSGSVAASIFELIDIWSAALRGLDLPGIRSANIADARIGASSFTLERSAAPTTLKLTSIEIHARRLSYPDDGGPEPELELTAHPFAESARLEVHATGRAIGGQEIRIRARSSNLPVHIFPVFHLRAGQAFVNGNVSLTSGTLAGPITIRLEGADVAPGAPIALKTGYTTLAASTEPELTVPVLLKLRDIDEGALALAVTKALAERAGKDVGKIVGGAARNVGGHIKSDVKKGLDRLKR